MTHDLEILTVPDDAIMLRRIPPYQYDAEKGTVHSKAFVNYRDKVDRILSDRHSVSWEALTSVEETLVGNEGFGVVSLPASAYRQLKQKVEHSPECDNYGHCHAIGEKTAGTQRSLRNQATLRVVPTEIVPPEDYRSTE